MPTHPKNILLLNYLPCFPHWPPHRQTTFTHACGRTHVQARKKEDKMRLGNSIKVPLVNYSATSLLSSGFLRSLISIYIANSTWCAILAGLQLAMCYGLVLTRTLSISPIFTPFIIYHVVQAAVPGIETWTSIFRPLQQKISRVCSENSSKW